MSDLEVNKEVVAEDSEELREGSSEAGAELARLEALERHGMLTHAADRNALAAARGQDEYDPDYVKDQEDEADEEE